MHGKVVMGVVVFKRKDAAKTHLWSPDNLGCDGSIKSAAAKGSTAIVKRGVPLAGCTSQDISFQNQQKAIKIFVKKNTEF
jgi:hypothetical protein